MSNGRPFQGSLFAEVFLHESVVDLPGWQDFDELMVDDVESGLRDIFAASQQTVLQRKSDRGRFDLSHSRPARVDGRLATAEPVSPPSRSRTRRIVIRAQCSKGPGQRLRRGMEAVRAWPRHRGIKRWLGRLDRRFALREVGETSRFP